MVKGGDSNQKVVSSNPSTGDCTDIFSHKFVVKNCTACLKKTEKEAEDGTFFKKVLSRRPDDTRG